MTLQNNLNERIWVEVNALVNYPIKAIMNEMAHADIVDMFDDSTQFSVSWVLCRVSEYGLKMFVNSWNHHTIPSTVLLICSKISIKRNLIYLCLKRSCLFYVFAASMLLIMEFRASHGKFAFQTLIQQALNVLQTLIQGP